MHPLPHPAFALLLMAGSLHAAVPPRPAPPPKSLDVVVMPAGQASLSQARSQPEYWRAQSAMPTFKQLPASAFDYNAAAAIGRTVTQASETGHPGGLDATGLAVRVAEPAPVQDAQHEALGLVAPAAVGTQGLHFTSSAVHPAQADTSFPLRATGKLWFEKVPGSGQWSVRSGTMIKPGIVVTAGHCVASGSGSWYGSFQFAPGYRNGAAPYGIWTSWATATTTDQWFTGGGGVPNAGDYALLVFNRNGSGYRIGDYTGWLGYQYPSLVGRHVTVLGYPNNLDSGSVNHRIDSQTTAGANGTGLWGSDMSGGSSGGAVVLNLRASYASSTATPSENNANRLVSVVSYGSTATGPMYQGGSVFDSRLGTMLSNMCTSFAWAC
ncbi:trypsin-like serine peptidase [Aquabacterium humicola]|uniref:trypsin-like serine peptidase n=1 Tax=Aquabacterium humicola TaxID=3237377 RepID=UPI002543933F|nr:trypsin-like peptidase domain-containing protein [Rubrivivax pictus]